MTRTMPITPSRSAIKRAMSVALLLAVSGAMAQSSSIASRPAADAPDESQHVTGSPTFSHLRLAGSTFHPVSTPGNFVYTSAGCIRPTVASRIVHHKLLLPDGAVVKYVRLYFRNTSTPDAPTAFFATYDMLGGYSQVPWVSGSNTGGYSSVVSDEMNHLVDAFAEPINISVNLGLATDGSVEFCGVRVAYFAPQPPWTGFADGFE